MTVKLQMDTYRKHNILTVSRYFIYYICLRLLNKIRLYKFMFIIYILYAILRP